MKIKHKIKLNKEDKEQLYLFLDIMKYIISDIIKSDIKDDVKAYLLVLKVLVHSIILSLDNENSKR